MKSPGKRKGENGSVLVLSLLILVLLSLIGIAASTTTNLEVRIAGNDKFHRIAFYAAEAARGFVARNTNLYGASNIAVGAGLNYPNDAVPTDTQPLGTEQTFRGDVQYLGSSQPPRGSGYEAGKFKAHRYQMTCNGFGPGNAQSQIQAGFYRIGF